MAISFDDRRVAYSIILVVGSLLLLPGLGTHALWEEDEAHNAQCVQEMQSADTWVVPTFNFKLRTDKPVLQYWCIRTSYLLFGVNEWSARLPSALAALAAMLLCWELGRTLFDGRTGLVAALLLGCSIMFNVAGHAVTPDAFLVVSTLAGFYFFARDYPTGRSTWLILCSATAGFAVLAKGPIGLVLPLGIQLFFLTWQRNLARVWHWNLAIGIALFLAITLPWYLLVGLETRFEFIRGFFFKHNISRFQTTMEGHGGSWWLHPVLLLVTFAPASVFLISAAVAAFIPERSDTPRQRTWSSLVAPNAEHWQYRLLGCWCVLWLGFFSLAATKLPGYLLPMFPALAILTARFLVRWLGGSLAVPSGLAVLAWCSYAGVGVVITVGLLLASGQLPGIELKGRIIPNLVMLAPVGLLVVVSACWAGYCTRRDRKWTALTVYLGSACILVAILAGVGPTLMQDSRAVRRLAAAINSQNLTGDLLIGCHNRYHPSLVFYTNRMMKRSLNDQQAVELIESPWPSYLVVAEKDWDRLAKKVRVPWVCLQKQFEFTAGTNLLLIFNQASPSVGYPEKVTSRDTLAATATHAERSSAPDSP